MSTFLNEQKAVKKFGLKGVQSRIKFLDENAKYMMAWESELGKELLSDLVNEATRKLDLITSLKADQNDIVAYSVLNTIIEKVTNKVNKFNETKESLK